MAKIPTREADELSLDEIMTNGTRAFVHYRPENLSCAGSATEFPRKREYTIFPNSSSNYTQTRLL